MLETQKITKMDAYDLQACFLASMVFSTYDLEGLSPQLEKLFCNDFIGLQNNDGVDVGVSCSLAKTQNYCSSIRLSEHIQSSEINVRPIRSGPQVR